MKLSEKLAALEEEEEPRGGAKPRRPPPPAAGVPKRTRASGRREGRQHVGRHQAQGARARARRGGPARCRASRPRSSPIEVKSALDQHPAARGRRGHAARAAPLRAGDDVRHPRLRAARPAARRRHHHRGDVQRLRRHLGGARRPHRAHRPVVHRRHPVPRGDRQDRVGRRPARRRGLADGRRPPARRLPRQRHHPAAGPPRLGAHHPEVLRRTRYTAKDLINFGTWTLDLVTVMEACVRGKLNILVSGGTGTGKTTNLNVLSAFIPDGERIITIEDSAELQLQQPHVINLETRPANAEGTGRGVDPRPRQERPAHAARPHHRRRVPRRRGARHAPGHEHRPRGLDDHGARQQPRATPSAASRRWC